MRQDTGVMDDRHNGFAAIETLAALGILGITFTALPALLVTTLHTNTLARNMTAATVLAQDKYEEIGDTPYDALASGTDTRSITAAGATRGVYTRSWNITAGPTATTKKVTVQVEWTEQTSRRVVLTSIVAK